MARVAFPITTFTDPEGDPLSFGYVILTVSTDAMTPDNEQIAQGLGAVIKLDIDGQVTNNPMVWPNAELNPADTAYIYSVFTAMGQELVYQQILTV